MAKEQAKAPPKGFFTELERLQPVLFVHCLALCRGEENSAWECLQETNMWLCANAARFDASLSSLKTFASRAAVVEAKKYFKGKMRWRARFVFAGEEIDAELFQDVSDDRLPALHACLAKLPEAEQEFIWEHYRDRKTMEEIGERRGLSVSGAKSKMMRLRRALAACVSKTMCRIELGVETPSVETAGEEFTVHALLLFDGAGLRRNKTERKGFYGRKLWIVPLAGIAAAATIFTKSPEKKAEIVPQQQEKKQEMKTILAAVAATTIAQASIVPTAGKPASTDSAAVSFEIRRTASDTKTLSPLCTKLTDRAESPGRNIKTTKATGTVIILNGN